MPWLKALAPPTLAGSTARPGLREELVWLREGICEDFRKELQQALSAAGCAPGREAADVSGLRGSGRTLTPRSSRRLGSRASPSASSSEDELTVCQNFTEHKAGDVPCVALPGSVEPEPSPRLVPEAGGASPKASSGSPLAGRASQLWPRSLPRAGTVYVPADVPAPSAVAKKVNLRSTQPKPSLSQPEPLLLGTMQTIRSELPMGTISSEVTEFRSPSVRAPALRVKRLTPAVGNRRSTGRRSMASTMSDTMTKTLSAFPKVIRFNRRPSGRKMDTVNDKIQFMDVVDAAAVLFIFLNGVFLGLQSDFFARNLVDTAPVGFLVVEVLFCVIFVTELFIRISRDGRSFLTVEGWQWNVFDSVLVAVQLVDVTMEVILSVGNLAFGAASAMKNVAFVRLLRILRILRLLRMVRLLQFFSELRVVIQALTCSLRSLVGTFLLIMLMIYIVGILFTQIVTQHRVTLMAEGLVPDPQIERWWGSLQRTTLSLYESILDGCDWDEVVTPLFGISTLLVAVFCIYIAFVLLAMMNVITGIFVQHALRNAEREKDKVVSDRVRGLYNMSDPLHSGMVHRAEFEASMQDSELQAYLREMGVDSKEVSLLFEMLDPDCTGAIEAEALLEGFLRLREGARYLDIVMLLYEVDQQNRQLFGWMQRTDCAISTLRERFSRVVAMADAKNPFESTV